MNTHIESFHKVSMKSGHQLLTKSRHTKFWQPYRQTMPKQDPLMDFIGGDKKTLNIQLTQACEMIMIILKTYKNILLEISEDLSTHQLKLVTLVSLQITLFNEVLNLVNKKTLKGSLLFISVTLHIICV